MVPISDALYEKLANLAARQGQPLEGVLDTLLSAVVATEDEASTPAMPLDWQSASAEEIIADLRKPRVERAHVYSIYISGMSSIT
jgi:hypothetical protein